MAYDLAIRTDVATGSEMRQLAKKAAGRRPAQRMLAIAKVLKGNEPGCGGPGRQHQVAVAERS